MSEKGGGEVLDDESNNSFLIYKKNDILKKWNNLLDIK